MLMPFSLSLYYFSYWVSAKKANRAKSENSAA